ncbi:expressed protein, partial [Phakopsora pachyrhizi]
INFLHILFFVFFLIFYSLKLFLSFFFLVVANASLQLNMFYPYTSYNHIYYTACSSYVITDIIFMLCSL